MLLASGHAAELTTAGTPMSLNVETIGGNLMAEA